MYWKPPDVAESMALPMAARMKALLLAQVSLIFPSPVENHGHGMNCISVPTGQEDRSTIF
jgi:hypothetical protein